MESVEQVTGAVDRTTAASPGAPDSDLVPLTDVPVSNVTAAKVQSLQLEQPSDSVDSRGSDPVAGQPQSDGHREPAQAMADVSGPANPWAPLLSAGLKLLESLAVAPSRANDGADSVNQRLTTTDRWVETDAQTGRSYLRLPMPEPQVLKQLTDALARLLR